MRPHRKSRSSYPNGIIGIYDNRGRTIDRYAVVFSPHDTSMGERFNVLYMSDRPFHSQGVGCTDEWNHRPTGDWGGHRGLGRCIDFTELPDDCQRAATDLVEKTKSS